MASFVNDHLAAPSPRSASHWRDRSVRPTFHAETANAIAAKMRANAVPDGRQLRAVRLVFPFGLIDDGASSQLAGPGHRKERP